MSSCDCCDDKSGNDEPNTEMEVSDSDQVNEGNVVAQVDETLALAASMKENGNASFKAGLLDEALTQYEGAIDAIKGLPVVNQNENKSVKSVLVALYGNVSMCRVKQEDWEGSIAAADEVILRDHENVKALYRRGLAKMKSNSLDAAKIDLSSAICIDPTNSAAKKELAALEKILKDKEKKEATKLKAAYAGNMFGGGSGGIYDDREKARAAKKKREEDEENRLRDEWTKSKLDRRNKGLPEQTFDDYKKELKEEQEKAKKEIEEKEKERKANEKSGSSTSAASPPKVSSAKKTIKKKEESESDDDDDDEDLKGLIKGYKKRSDGKKTSYFNNELDEETKALIGDTAPKALGDLSALDNSMPQPLPAAPGGGAAPSIAPSAWNHAGTFESKDMTAWAKSRLEQLLKQSKHTLPSDPSGNPPSLFGPVVVIAIEAKNVKGDAEIVISRGKKKAIYDMSADVTFEAVMDTSSATLTEKTFKGTVKLTDITGDDEPEYSYSFKKVPTPEHKPRLQEAVNGLVGVLKASLVSFKNEILEQ